MYDCEQDCYTDFSTTPACTAPTLRGDLCALHHGNNDGAHQLTRLLAWASEREIDANLRQGQLHLTDVSMEQALQINRLFGSGLIISCHLRRHPPAHI